MFLCRREVWPWGQATTQAPQAESRMRKCAPGPHLPDAQSGQKPAVLNRHHTLLRGSVATGSGRYGPIRGSQFCASVADVSHILKERPTSLRLKRTGLGRRGPHATSAREHRGGSSAITHLLNQRTRCTCGRTRACKQAGGPRTQAAPAPHTQNDSPAPPRGGRLASGLLALAGAPNRPVLRRHLSSSSALVVSRTDGDCQGCAGPAGQSFDLGHDCRKAISGLRGRVGVPARGVAIERRLARVWILQGRSNG